MDGLRAAWVPERSGMAWDEAVDLAVSWVRAECTAQSRRGLLVTVTKDSLGAGPLESFARANDWITPRSSQRTTQLSYGRPVLAYVPDEKALQLATRYARGSAICAVEGFGTKLSGWARLTGALNLLGEGSEPELDPRLIDGLNQLHFIGNNGWGDVFGRQEAHAVLAGLADQQLLNREAVVGDMLSRGHSPNSLRRLGAMIDKLAAGDLRPPRGRS